MTKAFAHLRASLSDEELLCHVLTGEEQAFDLLYDRHAGAVYRFALRMTGSTILAEDVTQDVFLALLRRAQLFDPRRGKVIQYLLGMTRNRVLTLLQREPAYVPLCEEAAFEEVGREVRISYWNDPLFELTRAERIEAVRQAILTLPVHYREVVVLCELEELSYEQAASVMGCPLGTVRSRLNRARTLLVGKLQPVENQRTAVTV